MDGSGCVCCPGWLESCAKRVSRDAECKTKNQTGFALACVVVSDNGLSAMCMALARKEIVYKSARQKVSGSSLSLAHSDRLAVFARVCRENFACLFRPPRLALTDTRARRAEHRAQP